MKTLLISILVTLLVLMGLSSYYVYKISMYETAHPAENTMSAEWYAKNKDKIENAPDCSKIPKKPNGEFNIDSALCELQGR